MDMMDSRNSTPQIFLILFILNADRKVKVKFVIYDFHLPNILMLYSVPRMDSGFLSTTFELSCEKEGDGEKKRIVEKITRKEGPGLRRHAYGMPCRTSPPPHLLIRAGGRGTAESPPPPPPPPQLGQFSAGTGVFCDGL
jgi:hypothetical protein